MPVRTRISMADLRSRPPCVCFAKAVACLMVVVIADVFVHEALQMALVEQYRIDPKKNQVLSSTSYLIRKATSSNAVSASPAMCLLRRKSSK